MGDNGGVVMRAVFYGGPADGGELTLAEPIRTVLRFPLTCAEALELLEPQSKNNGLVPNVESTYKLELGDAGEVIRDQTGRVRYRFVVPKQAARNPTPEGETPHD